MVPLATTHQVDVSRLVRRTEALLAAGVPLTLLLDLAEPLGPRSAVLLREEGGDASWLSA
jgi:hypothetical protein